MTQQIINIGTTPNDGQGDNLRVGMTKVNANFTDLYTHTNNTFNNSGGSITGVTSVNINTTPISSQPAPVTGSTLLLTQANGTPTRLQIDSYVSGTSPSPGVSTRAARGTAASPAAIQLSDLLGSISAHGYGTTSFQASSTGSLQFISEGSFSDTSQPTGIAFFVTPTGSTTKIEQLRLTSDGILKVESNIASTTTTTGSLLVTGGVGVSGALNVGSTTTGSLTVGNTLLSSSTGSTLVGYGSQTVKQALDVINNGTATNAGTLTGSETIPVSRGAGLLQTTIATSAQFAQSSTLATLATATGSTSSQGASLVGWDSGTIASFFKNRVQYQIATLSLLAAVDVTKYLQVYVAGYASAGDGGHAVWLYVSSLPGTSANGYTSIASSVGSGSWIMCYNSLIDVRALGIVVDGVTSNTTKLDSIIQTLSNIILYFPGGTCVTGTFRLKTGVSLQGEGSGATTLLSDGTCTAGLVTLPASGVVQKMFIKGMSINGHDSTSNQAPIQLVVGTTSNGTGWWYSDLEDVICGSFLHGIWLDGGSSTENNPIQFVNFKKVVARRGQTTGNALRCYGRVEHLTLKAGLYEYNSSSAKGTGDVILLQQFGADFTGSVSGNQLTVTNVTRGIIQIGQSVTATGVTSGTTISALGTGTGGAGTYTLSATFGTITAEAMTSFDTGAPTNFTAENTTIQNGLNGVHAVGATAVTFTNNCDFENIDTCALADNGAVSINIIGNSVRNSAYNGGGTGAILAGNNGTGLVGNNLTSGTINYTAYNYANNSAGVLDIGGNTSGVFTSWDQKTNGQTVQVNAASTISIGRARSVIVNTSATSIQNISSAVMPGEVLVVRAFGSAGTTINFITGGNISLPGRTSVTVVAGQAIAFIRVDLSGFVNNSGYIALTYPENRIEMNSSTNVAVPTTGTTVTIAATTNCQICQPAGTLAALTIQFPTPLGDGHTFELSITQSITTLTLTPNSGASIVGTFSSVTTYLATKYRYVASTTTWYEIA